MRKVAVLGLVAVTFTAVLVSCKSSSGGHCDAYGSADTSVQTDVEPT